MQYNTLIAIEIAIETEIMQTDMKTKSKPMACKRAQSHPNGPRAIAIATERARARETHKHTNTPIAPREIEPDRARNCVGQMAASSSFEWPEFERIAIAFETRRKPWKQSKAKQSKHTHTKLQHYPNISAGSRSSNPLAGSILHMARSQFAAALCVSLRRLARDFGRDSTSRGGFCVHLQCAQARLSGQKQRARTRKRRTRNAINQPPPARQDAETHGHRQKDLSAARGFGFTCLFRGCCLSLSLSLS